MTTTNPHRVDSTRPTMGAGIPDEDLNRLIAATVRWLTPDTFTYPATLIERDGDSPDTDVTVVGCRDGGPVEWTVLISQVNDTIGLTAVQARQVGRALIAAANLTLDGRMGVQR